jgi:hypothetical protein
MFLKKRIKITSIQIHVDILDLCWHRFTDAVKQEFLANYTITDDQKFEYDYTNYLEYKCKQHGFSGLHLIKGICRDIDVVYSIFGLDFYKFRYKSYFVTNYKFPYNISNVFLLK